MVQAGKGDLRTLANGLFPAGLDAASLTDEGRAEVRAAVDVILKLWDNRNTRLVLALEQLDKAANEIERLREIIRANCNADAERERCAKIAETEEEAEGEPSQELLDALDLVGPIENARAAIRATKKSIAARIRAASQ